MIGPFQSRDDRGTRIIDHWTDRHARPDSILTKETERG